MAGQNIFAESFRNSDVDQFQWLFGTSFEDSQSPILTARSGTSFTPGGIPGSSSAIDTSGNGALRLTNSSQQQGAFVIYDRPINSSSGLSVEFTLHSYGGTGADGISFFLVQGDQSPTSAGDPGGGLGYVNLQGAYLGIGYDEFGNFSNGRGGPGVRSQAVVVRGSQTNSYNYLTGTSLTGNRLDVPASQNGTRENSGRRTAINLSAAGILTVDLDLDRSGTFEANERVISNYNVVSTNGALPSTFKFGFAASTGALTNFHEIRDLSVNTFSGAYVPLVSFADDSQSIQPNGSTAITVELDAPTTQTVTIPLSFSGNAVRGTDYELSGTSITIQPGQTTGSVTLRGLNNTSGSTAKGVNVTIDRASGNFTGAALSPQDNQFNIVLTPLGSIDTSQPDMNGDQRIDLVWRSLETGQNAIWLADSSDQASGRNFYVRKYFIDSISDRNWQIVGSLDVNLDSKGDIAWRNTATGETAIWLADTTDQADGTNLFARKYFVETVDTNWQIVEATDVNGDNRSDFVWRNRATGQNAIWLADSSNQANGTTLFGRKYFIDSAILDWQVVASRDVNGDNKDDIVWRNRATGQNAIWLADAAEQGDGSNRFARQYLIDTLADSNWQIVDVADANGDNRADIMWQNRSTRQTAFWLADASNQANGTTLFARQYFLDFAPDSNWEVVAVRNANGDFKPDIVWRNQATGQDAIWLADVANQENGSNLFTNRYFIDSAPTDWRIRVRSAQAA